jgi:hypothetical protein
MMAFGIFARRHQDDEPPVPYDELPAEVAVAVAVGTMEVPAETDLEATQAAEAMMPRWRRPSLLLARRADSFHDATPAPRQTFDHEQDYPLDGHERRVIRYRLVRMLDEPDELRGTEIGYLDRGDEVQLVEKHGAYWLILCPNGRQGWVHNMTLGEVVDQQVQPDRPEAPVPLTADTWGIDEPDVDTDVLEAYLESRRRRA